MQTTHFTKLFGLTLVLTFGLTACGGSRTPAATATTTPAARTATTAGVVVEGGPAAPGTPSGAEPEPGVRVTSGAVASPMEGSCQSPDPSPKAKDLTSCMRSCGGWSDQVPLGSECVPGRTRCEAKCTARFSPL